MASVAALGFSIISRYNGRGIGEARRDLAGLRAEMAAFDKSNSNLGVIPKRWQAIGGAIAAVSPALIPLTAAVLSTTAAFVVMGTSVAASLALYGVAMKGAMKQAMLLDAQHKKMSSTQKDYVGSVKSMRGAWTDFIKQTSSMTLDTATHGIKGLTAGIKLLPGVIKAIHPAVLGVSKDFESWMKGDMAKEYARLIGDIAGKSLPHLVNAGKAVINVLGDGFRAFAPQAEGVATAIEHGAQALQRWSDGGGFQRFIEYVKANAPAVHAFWAAFGSALKALWQTLSGFSGGGLSVLTDALRAIATLNFENVKAAANSFLLLRSPLAWLVLNCPPLRDMIIKILDSLNPAIIYAFVAALTVFRVTWALVNAGFIATPIGLIITAILALVVAIVYIATKTTWFQTAWTYTWNAIQAVGMAVWSALQIAFNAFVGAMVTAWTAVSGALTTAWNTVWGALSTAAQAVWSGLQVAWAAFTGALLTGWNAFTGGLLTAWTAVSGALVAAWNAVWAGLSTAAQAVWTALQAAWTGFTTGLSTAWTAVSGALVAAWNAVWSAMSTAASAVWAAMQAAWNGFLTAMQTAWTAVSGAISAAWSAVWSAMQAAGQAIWSAMQAAWQAFLTAMQTAWTTVSAVLSAAWNAVWNALKLAATTIWLAMQVAWQAFLTFVQTVWTTFAAVFQAAWSVMWNAIKTAATTIWTALQTAWQTFTGAIGKIWDEAGAALRKAWDAIWDGIKGAAETVWEKIGGVVEKGVNGVIHLVNGIANGIENIAEKVGLHLWGNNPVPEVHFAYGGMVGEAPQFALGGSVNFSSGGGTLSGYAPGRDTVPAVLSRGEGVLTPEAVRGLGGAGFVHSANRQFAGHRGAGRGAAPLSAFGFSEGGTVGLGGGVQAWHRAGPDPGWSFALGGVPTEIPVPGGGTVGQTPGKDVNKPKGSVLDLLPDDLPDPAKLAESVLGLNGLNSLVLGFMGKEAITKLFGPLFDKIASYSGPGGDFSKIFVAAVKKAVTAAMEWLIKKDEDAKKEYESHAVAGAQSVSAWAALAKTAMVMGGLNPAQLPKFLALMAAESGGNPNAINTTDINAKNGIPSQGLMQVIPPTFAAYHVAGTSNNILDPLANMAASAAYIRARYGGNVPGSPYALGTPGATSGVHLVGEKGPELVNFAGGETVTPAGETASILTGAGTPAAMATAAPAAMAPASAGGAALGGGSGSATGGSNVSTPGDVQALIESLLSSSQELQDAMDAMWQKVIASTNAGWSSISGDSLTPMNAALAGTVPTSLTTMGTAWTTGWTKATTDVTTQWTAMGAQAFTPMNAMMSTEVPAAATTMSTGVTTATSAMQTGVQDSWDATLQGTQTTWTGVQTAITDSVTAATTPINGLLGGFNNVSSALGMGISVPLIAFEAGGVAQFSTGGMLAKSGGAVPGYSPGRDTFPAMLSPGEGVLTPEAVRGLGGPGFVFAANRKYSGHRGGGGSTSESLGKYMGHEAKCGHATGGMAGVMHNGVQHFASGTITAQDAAGLAEAGISTGSVSQGSFNSSVAASGSTHSGDGVVDISDLGAVDALRNAGWAAWLRTPEEGFAYHVHAVYMKATGVDPSAMGQELSFINGGSGLPAGSASTAETNRWGLNLGEWNFGPLIKEIVNGGITSVPQLLGPLVKKHLTKDQVASGFSDLKAALDSTNMGTGMFADSLMATGTKTHDGIVDNIAGQIGSASFDQGGLLQPGYTLAFNGTGKPEPVGHNLEPKGSGGANITIEVHTHGSATPEDVADGINTQVLPQLRQLLVQHG